MNSSAMMALDQWELPRITTENSKDSKVSFSSSDSMKLPTPYPTLKEYVLVETNIGKVMIEFYRTTTGAELKEAIQTKIGISAKKLALFFGIIAVGDSDRLSDLGVKDASVMRIGMTISGG
eukprot:TRINITY_DN1471_c0_g1_i5.p1 TRINITY_DN1471_c0_g1~~TRINITY_DN1471_c0_g1_i5.p1  ORF type:complete len:121 (+),score=17.86 TRINITY_DN1471_c0_g1_i5:135-497(+)